MVFLKKNIQRPVRRITRKFVPRAATAFLQRMRVRKKINEQAIKLERKIRSYPKLIAELESDVQQALKDFDEAHQEGNVPQFMSTMLTSAKVRAKNKLAAAIKERDALQLRLSEYEKSLKNLSVRKNSN